ncbi:MAG: YtxH domain-containing protein [Canibacter sp.]
MKGKLALVVGFAAGYVLGSRAGRNRYNQIKRVASNVWEADSVQSGVEYVQDFAEARFDDARDFVADKVGSVISSGRSSAKKSSSQKSANSSGNSSQKES